MNIYLIEIRNLRISSTLKTRKTYNLFLNDFWGKLFYWFYLTRQNNNLSANYVVKFKTMDHNNLRKNSRAISNLPRYK